MSDKVKALMGTKSAVSKLQATTRINLSAIGIGLTIVIALWITVGYLSNIPQMIAASTANYLRLLIG